MRVKEAVRKKVRFYREEVNKKKSLVGWRKPKGIHNKSRLRKQRHSLLPKIGYAGAKVGKNLIYVMTINDLNKLNKENDVIILSGKLGMKKRIIMLEEIKKNGFILYNYRDLGVKKKELEEKINKRKNENKQKQEKRSKTKEELKETKENIRNLIKEKIIKAKQIKGTGRFRARKISAQKRKKQRKGLGSRKGKAGARLGRKEKWMAKIRLQRKLLKELKEKKLIELISYRMLRKRSSGGFFRSRKNILR